ncbi:MAG: tryptophan-rich sensory protein [Candidatus Kerfeldbacteria bacterium]|nr:tryptophan-rich sensory protein [Candidatus Kerfeldbacteria bacterium]
MKKIRRTSTHSSFFIRASLIAVVLAIAVNVLANIAPFNGMTTGEISDLYPLSLTPLGYVFSIWALIYIGLMAYVAYAMSGKLKHLHSGFFILCIVSCVANSGWILAWHSHQLCLSMIFMLILLFALIRMNESFFYVKCKRIREYMFVRVPFQIYLAWITFATVLNIGALFYGYGITFDGMTAELFAITTLGLVTYFTTTATLRYKSIPFALVVAWAACGIVLKSSITLGVALSAALVVGWHLLLVLHLLKQYNQKQLSQML